MVIATAMERSQGDWMKLQICVFSIFTSITVLHLDHVRAAGSPEGLVAAGQTFQDTLSSGEMGPEMVVVPAGSFLMGSPESEIGRLKSEGPQFEVVISSFVIGKSEITVDQFAKFVKSTNYKTVAEKSGGCWLWGMDSSNFSVTRFKWLIGYGTSWRNPGFEQTPDHPVSCISWEDATAYANWLSNETGKSYRLPSESEWEYAARAGSTTKYNWGDEISRKFANYGGEKCCEGFAEGADNWVNTAPVNAFPANKFGLYDVHGNVAELTEDCWHIDYKATPASGNAKGPENGGDCSNRVARGGGWLNAPKKVRAANRIKVHTGEANYFTGLRVARDL